MKIIKTLPVNASWETIRDIILNFVNDRSIEYINDPSEITKGLPLRDTYLDTYGTGYSWRSTKQKNDAFNEVKTTLPEDATWEDVRIILLRHLNSQ